MTALPRRIVYLDGTDLEGDCEALMRFLLTYNGPLKATQPSHMGYKGDLYTDKRAEHKHEIRQQFHGQLRHLWKTNRFLSETRHNPYTAAREERSVLPEIAKSIDWVAILPATAENRNYQPMSDILAECYRHSNYRFVPLVRQEISLSCSLHVLFLRRDFPAPVLSAGDIDNRLKTLVDALRMPQAKEGVPVPPSAGEDPFFVLLDDDRQITHLEAETDIALAAGERDPNDVSFARVVVTVEVRPYDVTMFNLAFA